MTPRIFLTGPTGYIGGDALFAITKAHPEWDITCLVRNTAKGSKVAAAFPKVKLVYGDLSDSNLIEEESAKADVVYDLASSDHGPSAVSVARGLARRDKPGFWIHLSGAMCLAYETIRAGTYGENRPKVFNDWDGVSELVSLPNDAAHRSIEKIVLKASEHPNIQTAIVSPPAIHGVGRGPDNQRSVQAYMTTASILQQKVGLMVGKGRNIWNEVHVHDLSNLFVLLGEAAAVGGAPATWNDQGYYLVENGEIFWGEICQKIAMVAHKKKLLPSEEVVSLPGPWARALFLEKLIGTDCRGTSIRARKLLGWEPKGRKLVDEIPYIVESEARTLGLIKGHAEKVIS